MGRKAQAPTNWKIFLVYLRFYKNTIMLIATIKDNEVQERLCEREEVVNKLNKGKKEQPRKAEREREIEKERER